MGRGAFPGNAKKASFKPAAAARTAPAGLVCKSSVDPASRLSLPNAGRVRTSFIEEPLPAGDVSGDAAAPERRKLMKAVITRSNFFRPFRSPQNFFFRISDTTSPK